MHRDRNLLEKRRDYIKERLNNSDNLKAEVMNVSNELFISESTVWRDYSTRKNTSKTRKKR